MSQRTTQLGATHILSALLKIGPKIKGTLPSYLNVQCKHFLVCCMFAVVGAVLTQLTVLVRIFLQFEAVGSAFYCWVNGTMVGYAQDTFLSSEFDVTKLLKPGSNHLAVQASPSGIAAL